MRLPAFPTFRTIPFLDVVLDDTPARCPLTLT